MRRGRLVPGRAIADAWRSGCGRCFGTPAGSVERVGRTFEGPDASIVPFVISHNLHRRHLTKSQGALVAGRIANVPPNMRPCSLGHGAITLERAAEMLNVSKNTVRRGRKVLEKGAPELADAVRDQKISINAAAEIAGHPPEEQRRRLSAHRERSAPAKRQKGTPNQCGGRAGPSRDVRVGAGR